MAHLKYLNSILLAALVWQFSVTTHAAESRALYRWVDEKGQVHYGDKVPPGESKQGRESIKNGIVTKKVPRELKGAELEREQARLAEVKVAAEAYQQRAANDRYLLQSFASVADLQDARDQRLNSLDARIQLAEKAVVENEKTLADLRARSSGKPPDPVLRTQIETFEGSLIDNLQAVHKLRQERTATEARYTTDIARFKGLKMGTIKKGD